MGLPQMLRLKYRKGARGQVQQQLTHSIFSRLVGFAKSLAVVRVFFGNMF